jgi:DNA polymerase I
MIRLPYRSIILCDTEYEFAGVESNLPRPVCVVAKDYTTSREWRLRRGEFGTTPPFPTGPEDLFVAFYASAEIGVFDVLGWPHPQRILDLFTEFRNLTNGLAIPTGNSLIGALIYFGLPTMGAEDDNRRRPALSWRQRPRPIKPVMKACALVLSVDFWHERCDPGYVHVNVL